MSAHTRSLLTSEVTPNPGSWIMESVMCVTSLCVCGTTHTHSHRNGFTKTSICQINNPWRIKHTRACQNMNTYMLIMYLYVYLQYLHFYLSTSVYLTSAAVFLRHNYTSEHTHTRWWYPSLLYAHHAVTKQPASAAQHCGIPLGSVLRMSTLTRLRGSVCKESSI